MAFATTPTNMSNNHSHTQRTNNITCYRCGRTGHYATNCPTGEVSSGRVGNQGNQQNSSHTNQVSSENSSSLLTEGTDRPAVDATQFIFYTHGQNEVSLHTTKGLSNIPESWILLDNQSTIDVFSNPKLLVNIRRADKSMNILSTGGVSHTEFIGNLPGYGTVWYQPNGIANILSLARLCKQGYVITYSRNIGNKLTVTKKEVQLGFSNSQKRGYTTSIQESLHQTAQFSLIL